tara:strand:- start:3271 stop:4011 length:741 start_codon:yes stop_codon:yes gene_type:complete
MVSPTDGQRDIKRQFRNKGFQTPFAKVGASVDPSPPPISSYSTTTHVATSPLKPGLTSAVQQREVIPLVGVDAFRAYNYRTTPWHLYPKADSGNVIQRNRNATDTIAAGGSLDLVSVFVTDSGTTNQAATAAAAGMPSSTFWVIKKFGHAELNTATAGVTYQILVDGQITLSWDDFQMSPSAPYNQLWAFENPITVRSNIVFRVINGTGAPYDCSAAGNAIDATFVGWTEQYVFGSETEHTNVEPQ